MVNKRQTLYRSICAEPDCKFGSKLTTSNTPTQFKRILSTQTHQPGLTSWPFNCQSASS